MLICLLLFLICVPLSMFFTWKVTNLAHAHGWAVPPSAPRHVHRGPIPRLGGIAIYLSFLVTIGAAALALKVTGRAFPVDTDKLLHILITATLIFAVGLWDDIRSLSPWWKFAAQIVAGMMLYSAGLRIIHARSFFGGHEFGTFTAFAATVLWVVWITNAFNLIDGVDGLAAGSALLSTFVLFLNALIAHDGLTQFITAALAGAILGFLRFNFNPARIFLGDCGSLFIGFSLSALALAQTQKSPTLVAVSLPVVALGLPIMDTVLAVARRFISGKPLFVADREHIHHKLLEKGFSQRQVVVLLYGVSAAFGLVALFLRYPGGRVIGAVMVMVGAVVVLGVQRLGYIEFFELRRVAQRTLEQRQVIINNLLVRRAQHELEAANTFDQVCSALEHGFADNDIDSFQLAVSREEIAASTLPLSVDGNNATFEWSRKSGSAPSGWELKLGLTTSRGKHVGTFSLFRTYEEGSFMLDLNLLTGDFATVLADSVERSISSLDRVRETRPVFVVSSSSFGNPVNSNL